MQKRINPYALQSDVERLDFENTNTCYICKKLISQYNKVRTHCHFCGKLRGAVHSDCNIAFRLNNNVQVIVNNLGRYDDHLIMQSDVSAFIQLLQQNNNNSTE